MNQKVKGNWIKALRSGDYQQGKGELHHPENNTFCCLGVLCDIAITEGWVWTDEHIPNFGLIPEKLMQETGLSITLQVQLSRMNDVDKLSFKEIADWIELYL